jgi:hypothetical protein
VKSELDRRDHEICEAIGPSLIERGLIFVGIDVIGGYMTEINVTSPTGIQEIDLGRHRGPLCQRPFRRRTRAPARSVRVFF